tara:strand:+ start:1969 stop:2232 length:264 start_codon:yes stop_codon:yes gene_type:complete
MTVIDISQENVFPLMKVARALSKADNLNTQKILKEMTEKDTLHFVEVFNKYFGDLCKMEWDTQDNPKGFKLNIVADRIDEFNAKIGA